MKHDLNITLNTGGGAFGGNVIVGSDNKVDDQNIKITQNFINKKQRSDEENLMSNISKYNFPNADTVIITETNHGEVIGKKYATDPEVKSAIKEVLKLLQNLQANHPNVSESEATDIINAEFTVLQTQNPNQWQNLKQQLLNKECWLKGGKAALVATAEHYVDNSVIYQAGLAFLDEFSANS